MSDPNPGRTLEALYAREQDYRRYAEEADADGRPLSAKLWRRKAAGVKGAYNRLARSL